MTMVGSHRAATTPAQVVQKAYRCRKDGETAMGNTESMPLFQRLADELAKFESDLNSDRARTPRRSPEVDHLCFAEVDQVLIG